MTSLNRVRPGKRPRPPAIHQCFTTTRRTLSLKPKPPPPSAGRLEQQTLRADRRLTEAVWWGGSYPNLLLITRTRWRKSSRFRRRDLPRPRPHQPFILSVVWGVKAITPWWGEEWPSTERACHRRLIQIGDILRANQISREGLCGLTATGAERRLVPLQHILFLFFPLRGFMLMLAWNRAMLMRGCRTNPCRFQLCRAICSVHILCQQFLLRWPESPSAGLVCLCVCVWGSLFRIFTFD